MPSNGRRTLLAAGDVIALVVFTVIGLLNHKDGVTVAGVLKVVGPIVLVGTPAALIFGTYRRPNVSSLLPTWALAVPAGILIRKGLFDTPSTWGSTGVFIVVALAFTLVFLLAWRLLAHLLNVNTVFGES